MSLWNFRLLSAENGAFLRKKSLAHTYLLRGAFASYILMKIVPIYCRFRIPNGKLQFRLKYFSIHFPCLFPPCVRYYPFQMMAFENGLHV